MLCEIVSFVAGLLVPLDKLYLLGVHSELSELLLARLSIVAAYVCCSRQTHQESQIEQVGLHNQDLDLCSKYLSFTYLGSRIK